MKAAIVVEAGKAPIYGDFPDPVTAKGEVLVTVSAAALSNLVRMRASGTHYSKSGQVPFVVGVDGWAALMMAAACILCFRKRRSVAWQRKPSCSLPDAFRCRTDWMM